MMFFVHLIIFCVVMYYIQKWLNKKFPEPKEGSDAQFLSMCCRRLGTNITEVFREAARESGLELDEKLLLKDVKIYLHGETEVPHYVRKFIDEGRRRGL